MSARSTLDRGIFGGVITLCILAVSGTALCVWLGPKPHKTEPTLPPGTYNRVGTGSGGGDMNLTGNDSTPPAIGG